MHCKSTEARETRAMLTVTQAGAEGVSGNKDPFAACVPFVDHGARYRLSATKIYGFHGREAVHERHGQRICEEPPREDVAALSA
jgi:hypothetical protein